jgi:hypothetical protein
MRRPVFLIAFLTIGMASSTSAQTVRGQVRDTLTTAPLGGTTITVFDSEKRQVAALTASDNGSFTLGVLQPGKYEIAVRRVGFTPKTQAFRIDAEHDALVVVWMLQIATTLQPVETRAKWLGTWWRPNLTRGAEYVRRHIALGKGIIVSGDEIRASGLPMTEYLSTFEGIKLWNVAPPGTPVVPGSRGRFLSSVYGANCLYARVDRNSMAFLIIHASVEDVDDLLKLGDIMAVEVFRNSHELPPEWKLEASIEAIVERRNAGMSYWMGHTNRPKLTPDMYAIDSMRFSTRMVFAPADLGKLPARRRDFVERPKATVRTIQQAPMCGFMQIWTKIAW